VWWEHHGATPVKANQLAEPVKAVADPQGRGRQYLATFIAGARRHSRCRLRAHPPRVGRQVDGRHLCAH
jgi:hypothetical protein